MSLKSVFSLRCPACEKGRLFEGRGNALAFEFRMHKNCLVCGEKLDREPGFYYGAMFISYILSGILSLLFVGVLILWFKMDWMVALGVLFAALVILYAYLFKVSRSIWIHFFVSKKH